MEKDKSMSDRKWRIWQVEGATRGGYWHGPNITVKVVSETMEGAMKKVKDNHPKIIFVSVTHKGEVQL